MQLFRGMRLPRLCQRKPVPARWSPVVADAIGDQVGDPTKDTASPALNWLDEDGENNKQGNDAQSLTSF